MSIISCYDANGNLLKRLFQWDSNVTIVIQGLEISDSTTIHFCNRLSENALVVTPVVSETDLRAEVPNILLQEAEPIIAYVFQETASGAHRTTHAVHIPVVPRAKPDSYEYVDNGGYVDYSTLAQDIEELNQKIENLEVGSTEWDSVGNKPFSTLDLSVFTVTDGVLSIIGGAGGSDAPVASATINDIPVSGDLDSVGDLKIAGKSVSGETVTVDDEEYVCGNGAEVHNDYGTNIALGTYSSAFGSSNSVLSDYSLAAGKSNTVGESTDYGFEAHYSFATGFGNKVTRDYSSVFGFANTSTNYYQFVGGSKNGVYGTNDVVIGDQNTSGIAKGADDGTGRYGGYNVVLGNNNHVDTAGYSNVSIGSYNTITNNAERCVAVGYTNTIDSDENGNSPYNVVVLGSNCTVSSGDYSVITGYNNFSAGTYNFAEGRNNESSSGSVIHIEGENNQITNGAATHIEGQYNIVTGSEISSHIEGANNVVQGGNYVIHVEGSDNTVVDDKGPSSQSHISGQGNSMDSCTNTHIMGSNNNVSSGYGSFVGGQNCDVVDAFNCLVFGNGLKLKELDSFNTHNSITVLGYNNADVEDTYLLVIGNGESDDERSNAFVVTQDGDIISATGKGLSEANFTNEEKTKISTIENHSSLNRVTIGVACKNILPKHSEGSTTTNGITFTTNTDGSVTATGTATGDAYYVIATGIQVAEANRYILSGCPEGGGTSTYQLYLSGDISAYDRGSGTDVWITTSNSFSAYIQIKRGQTVDLTFYPMLRLKSITSPTYAEYTPTLQAQIKDLKRQLDDLRAYIEANITNGS